MPYENTSWEEIARLAPIIGAIATTAALIVRDRLAERALETAAGTIPSSSMNEYASEPLLVLGIALVTLSAPFVAFWSEVHATIPTWFGGVMLAVGAGAAVVAPLARLARLVSLEMASAYAGIVVSGALVVAIAASSSAIIAEGIVTAMTLPIALCCAVTIGVGVASMLQQRASLRPSAPWAGAIACLAVLIFVGYQLPIVQFRAGGRSNAIYPVYGGTAAFVVSLLTGAVVGYVRRFAVRVIRWSALFAVLVCAYVVQAWYGVALAVFGVVVSYAAGVSLRADR